MRKDLKAFNKFKLNVHCFNKMTWKQIKIIKEEFDEKFVDVVFLVFGKYFSREDKISLKQMLNDDEKNLFKGKSFIINIKKGHSIINVLDCFTKD